MENANYSAALCYLEQLDYLFSDAVNKSAAGRLTDVQISLSIAMTILENLRNLLVKSCG